jgi:hypothetical protein
MLETVEDLAPWDEGSQRTAMSLLGYLRYSATGEIYRITYVELMDRSIDLQLSTE